MLSDSLKRKKTVYNSAGQGRRVEMQRCYEQRGLGTEHCSQALLGPKTNLNTQRGPIAHQNIVMMTTEVAHCCKSKYMNAQKAKEWSYWGLNPGPPH